MRSMRGSATLDDIVPKPDEATVVDFSRNVPAFLAKLTSWVDFHPALVTDASASLVQACASAVVTVAAEYLCDMSTITTEQSCDEIFNVRVQSMREDVSIIESKFELTTPAEMEAVVRHAERVVAALGSWIEVTYSALNVWQMEAHVQNAIIGVFRLVGDAFGVLGVFLTTRARGFPPLPVTPPQPAPEKAGDGDSVSRCNMFHLLLDDVRTFTNVDTDNATYLAACRYIIFIGKLQLAILERRATRDHNDAPSLDACKRWLRQQQAQSFTSADVRILGPRFQALRETLGGDDRATAKTDIDELELVMAGLDSITAPPPPSSRANPGPPPAGTVPTRQTRARSPAPEPATKRGRRTSPPSGASLGGGKGQGKRRRLCKYHPLLKLWYLINRSMADDPAGVKAPREMYSHVCNIVENLYGGDSIWRHRVDNLQNTNFLVEYACDCPPDVKQHKVTCDMIMTEKGVQAAEALPSFAELMRLTHDRPNASARDVLNAIPQSIGSNTEDKVARALKCIKVRRIEELLLDEGGGEDEDEDDSEAEDDDDGGDAEDDGGDAEDDGGEDED